MAQHIIVEFYNRRRRLLPLPTTTPCWPCPRQRSTSTADGRKDNRNGTDESVPAVPCRGRLARGCVRRAGRQDCPMSAGSHFPHRPAAQARVCQVQRHRQRVSRVLHQHRRVPETTRSAGRRPTKHGELLSLVNNWCHGDKLSSRSWNWFETVIDQLNAWLQLQFRTVMN